MSNITDIAVEDEGLKAVMLLDRKRDDLDARTGANQEGNFVEISNIPKRIEARALTSMIVTMSRIIPKATEICYKDDDLEAVGLIEFKSAIDAFKAVDKIRSSIIARRWKLKIIANPKFRDPEKEMINRWLR